MSSFLNVDYVDGEMVSINSNETAQKDDIHPARGDPRSTPDLVLPKSYLISRISATSKSERDPFSRRALAQNGRASVQILKGRFMFIERAANISHGPVDKANSVVVISPPKVLPREHRS